MTASRPSRQAAKMENASAWLYGKPSSCKIPKIGNATTAMTTAAIRSRTAYAFAFGVA